MYVPGSEQPHIARAVNSSCVCPLAQEQQQGEEGGGGGEYENEMDAIDGSPNGGAICISFTRFLEPVR